MKGIYKGVGIALTFFIVLGMLFNYGIIEAFGNDNNQYIKVDTYGTGARGGAMFNKGLWGPGVEQEGIMRLSNNYSQRVKVRNLALTLKLEKFIDGEYQPVEDPELIKLYAENMRLTVTKGKMLVFNETLFEESFYEMMYVDGNYQFEGYSLPSSKQFNISRNGNVDLKYTVKMAEEAGNQLQGLKATVDFIVNLRENPEYIEDDRNVDGDYPKPDKPNDQKPKEDQHWAHDCIEILLEKGIIQGYPDGTIRPDHPITRAETAVLVARALNLEEENRMFTGYRDFIPPWARGSIIATTRKGIFKGYPISLGKATVGRVFKANDQITREEVATVLMRGFQVALQEEVELNFYDHNDISEWALPHIKAGVQSGIILGYPDDTFKPKQEITRAEVFTLICKLLGYHLEHEVEAVLNQ